MDSGSVEIETGEVTIGKREDDEIRRAASQTFDELSRCYVDLIGSGTDAVRDSEATRLTARLCGLLDALAHWISTQPLENARDIADLAQVQRFYALIDARQIRNRLQWRPATNSLATTMSLIGDLMADDGLLDQQTSPSSEVTA